MAKNLYEELTRPQRPRRRRPLLRALRWGLLLYLLYFAVEALAPFAFHPPVSAAVQASFDPAAFYGSGSPDRAALVLDNQDALDLRLQMIAQAQESIVLTSFDIRDCQSTRDLFAALLAASERGVQIQILWDGFSGFLRGRAPVFYALGSRDNVEIRFYNEPNFLLPWTFNGRMHDKYLIVDHQLMVLGGRNTFDLFLGNYVPDSDKSHDNDVLIWNTAATAEESVIGQVEDYFAQVWAQRDSRPVLDAVPFWRAGTVEEAEAALRALPSYQAVPARLDYAALTVPVDRCTLLTNPTGILAKEPVLWWQLQQLMEGAEERVYLQTPYAVPSREMYEGLARVAAKGIPFALQINSVAVGDNFVASSDYLTNRDRLLDTGATVWEWFGDYSSHGKAALIDDLALVGSYNFDMRSTSLDTEMMLVFDSPDLLALLEEHLSAMKAQCLQAVPEGYLPRPGVEEKPYQDPKSVFYPVTRWITQPFRFLL